MNTGLGAGLDAVLAAHGGRWQVGQDAETGAWFAVERPKPTALHVLVGPKLAEMAAKLDVQEGRDG